MATSLRRLLFGSDRCVLSRGTKQAGRNDGSVGMQTNAGEGEKIGREGTRARYKCTFPGRVGRNTSGVIVEHYRIMPATDPDAFEALQNGGIEMIYILETVVGYRCRNDTYGPEPVDMLF